MNESALTVTKKKDFKAPLDSKHSQHVIIHHEYVVNSPEHQDYLLSVPQVFFPPFFFFLQSYNKYIWLHLVLKDVTILLCQLLQFAPTSRIVQNKKMRCAQNSLAYLRKSNIFMLTICLRM